MIGRRRCKRWAVAPVRLLRTCPVFGTADKPADFDYTVDGYANHIEALLAALQIERVHLVLHDFGGPWGLAWAARDVSRVASLTLINIGILPDYRWHYLARIWRTPVIGELSVALTTRFGFGLLLKHGNPRGLPKEFLDEMYQNFDSGTKRAVLRLYRATSALGEFARAGHDALRPADLETLVIWGKCDPYLPHRFAERQRETFPRAQINYMDDSGHWPFMDNPQTFAEIIVPFLQRVTA